MKNCAIGQNVCVIYQNKIYFGEIIAYRNFERKDDLKYETDHVVDFVRENYPEWGTTYCVVLKLMPGPYRKAVDYSSEDVFANKEDLFKSMEIKNG